MEKFVAYTAIHTEDNVYEFSALIGEKGYECPSFQIDGQKDLWDNPDYLLNEVWPYLKQSEKFTSTYWERTDSFGDPFDPIIPDDRVEELLSIFNKGVALGFLRTAKKR